MAEEKKKTCRAETKAAIILAGISAGMLLAAGLTPPMWIIDGSVLAAVGELFAFAALFKAGEAIDRGIDAKVTHGKTTVEFNNPDNKKEDEDAQD